MYDIDGHKDLARDPRTNMIVNVNNHDYEHYIAARDAKKLKSDDYFYQRSVEYLYPIRLNEKFKKTFFSRNEEIPNTCNIIKKYKQLILVEC